MTPEFEEELAKVTAAIARVTALAERLLGDVGEEPRPQLKLIQGDHDAG